MIAIANTLIVLAAIIMSAGSASAAPCGPFGDPPAEVNHGAFASFLTRHVPVCKGGKVLGPWKDADGDERYSCLYEPASASKENPLPLVVFLHGSVATADSVSFTGLSDLIDKSDLGGQRPGFILLAPEGRYTSHFYPGFDSNAFGWDNWYRQLSPSGAVIVDGIAYPENADAGTIDHFVSAMDVTGEIDSQRIYLMGWSNGAAMALLYAMNRPWVASAAVYSAPDPFGAFLDVCTQVPVAGAPAGNGQVRVFNPRVPLMHLRNSCDIAGICPNGSKLAAELRAMGGNIDDIIVDPSGNKVTSCDESCGTDKMGNGKLSAGATLRGVWHHMRWPSAWNENMLAFLKQHPLGAAADRPR
ncbi:MAG: PHB depolymerase family esterase [Candidatus Binataceae bacterium]